MKIGESEVKMHVGCSGAMDLDHKSRVLYKTQGRILQWCWSTVIKDLELPSHCEQSIKKIQLYVGTNKSLEYEQDGRWQ